MDFKTARKEKELTQFNMAVKLGVTERTWRRWERSESGIPSAILPKLQEVLGLSDTEVLDIIKALQKEAS